MQCKQLWVVGALEQLVSVTRGPDLATWDAFLTHPLIQILIFILLEVPAGSDPAAMRLQHLVWQPGLKRFGGSSKE